MNIIRLQGDVEKRRGVYYEYDVDAIPLGEGGMGRVFKGYRVVEVTGERMPVAIKAIYDNIPDRVVERARREANIQIDNDNLIRMYGFVETESQYAEGVPNRVHYHVIMELLIGVTLENIINGVTSDQNGMQIPFAAEIYSQYTQDRYAAVVRIMKPILSGLMALHDKGYIHRDIDPSNIMVTIDGKIKLIDFGICKQITTLESLDKALTASGVFMGKVNYAAPELVLGDVKSQNYTTDIYALGILLYQLCTGHLPFSGTDQDILSANLRSSLPMKDVREKSFKRIIRKATEKVQSKRYASIAELRVDLERCAIRNGKSDLKKIRVFISTLAAIIVLAFGIALFLQIKHDANSEIIEHKPTREEIFDGAIAKLNQKDSVHLWAEAKEQLRVLADDSLYFPAKMKYYVLLLNSRDPEEVKKGFAELEQIASNDLSNSIALFECGLTLSKGNRFFNVPTIRQSLLNIDVDLERANQLLLKSIDADVADYKAVYWTLNNLIEMKVDGTLPLSEDKQLTKLYKMFEERIAKFDDPTAEIYRNAIESDTKTLKAWGLIK